jgi:hypothetical protein
MGYASGCIIAGYLVRSVKETTLANPEHLAKINEGVKVWNEWRRQKQNLDIPLDLSEADFRKANLLTANLASANLRGANLWRANLLEADLIAADLCGADLTEAYLGKASLFRANLSGANLSGSFAGHADFNEAKCVEAKFASADLHGVDLTATDMAGADLGGANLTQAILVDTNLEGANLSGCSVYGVSVWNAKLQGATQSNLVITPKGESPIQVDNLEVAQFIYLLLNNERIRNVIDTITSKVVLILGRFTPQRKLILDAIRDELRKRDYLPVLFDFDKPTNRDLTGTITTLANMARFIIADLTDPNSVPHELATIIPLTVVPIHAIILEGQRTYPMFEDYKRRYSWVLEPHQYQSEQQLIAQLGEQVIAPAEAKAKELAQP